MDNAPDVVPTCHREPGSGVLVTFDDNGTPEQVRATLAALRQNDMRAAFFPTGEWAETQLDLIREMQQQGHIVGSHTQTHPRLSELARDDHDAFYSEIYPLHGVATTDPMILRLPFGDGASDPAVLQMLTEKNVQACTWSADSRDWDGSDVPTMMTRLTEGDAYSDPIGEDGVVLFHLHSEHAADMVSELAEYLAREGLAWERLSEVPESALETAEAAP